MKATTTTPAPVLNKEVIAQEIIKDQEQPAPAAPVKKSLKEMSQKERDEYYKALSAKALAAKQAKANGTIKPEPKEAPAPAITRKPAEAHSKALMLANYSLDELIRELRSRGCKGSIHISTKIKL